MKLLRSGFDGERMPTLSTGVQHPLILCDLLIEILTNAV
jgi:hypothetical protein